MANPNLGNISSIQTPAGNPEFVDLQESFKCLECHGVLRDAMQTTCGHRICETCVNTMFQGKEEVPCPAKDEDCFQQKKNDITPDPSGRREVRKLKVFCTNKPYGCTYKCMWKDLERHVMACEYKPSECPNKEYGCNETIPLKTIESHKNRDCQYRLEACQFCKNMVPMIKQQDHEKNECMAVKVACGYNCGSGEMSRVELNRHLDSCPNKPKECKFKSIGCTFTGTERLVAEHMLNDLNSHLELMTMYTANMDLQSMEMRRQMQEVTAERDQLRQMVQGQRDELTIMQTQIEKVNNANKELKMKMVSMTERIIHLERRSEEMAKKEIVDKHDRDVRALQTTLTQVRTQVATIERQGVTGGNRAAAGNNPDVTEVSRRVDLHDGQFAQLDVQMAELDLRFQILETASYDGTLLWKLRDYPRRKADAVSAKTLSLYSQPFYTHRFGYKMCARVYLNGDGMGKGSHMSLFFVIMRGEYDNLLPWPFQQKVTMILLDQETGQTHLSDTFRPDPTSSSFKKPTTEMNIASGCPLFVSHTVLETQKYTKDDTLFIKFVVDLSNLNHP